MKLSPLAFLGSTLVGAINQAMWCVPSDCKVDSNCFDSIHPYITGKCCGGKCVRLGTIVERLIGEQCATANLIHADNYEQCFSVCSGGLFCNTVDERCHAKHGVGCPCQAGLECLSNRCRGGSRTCAAVNLPYGEDCEENGECQSNLCVDNKCSALAIGEICSSISPPCVPEAVCRGNVTFAPTYCLSPCAAGEANCCFSGSSACAKTPANLVCDSSGNYSCNLLPGLGEACSLVCNSTTTVCALTCDGGGCNAPRVCQLKNQVAVGFQCDSSRTEQCVVGASCQYSTNNFQFECTVNAPTNSPTSAPTNAALNSVPLGQPCGDYLSYDVCLAPGNMCERNASGVFVCKQSGTTPVGAFCSISNVNINVRALDECVNGSRCTKNASSGSFACHAPIPVGQRCYSTGTYQNYAYSECANGWNNCAMTGRGNCSSCDSNDINGNPCCTCTAPRTIADGGNCSASSQCQNVTSLCVPKSSTCVNIQGNDCLSQSDCMDTFQFDCNCDHKCYLINTPTPSPLSAAPTASTRAPSMSPCEARQKAWQSLNASSTLNSFSPYLSYSSFHTDFLPAILKLTEADQAILIAYICCATCPPNHRFNSRISEGYQVDCGAKKLIKLEDTCDDLRNTWAFSNCWEAIVVNTSVPTRSPTQAPSSNAPSKKAAINSSLSSFPSRRLGRQPAKIHHRRLLHCFLLARGPNR